MFVIKLIRKFFSLFRSNLSSHEIALGFCFGILLGCIPISSFFAVAAVLCLILVLRASLTVFIAAAVIVKLLSFAIDPVLFHLGTYALEGPINGLFEWIVNRPVLALLDLHRYVVAGGVIFTLLCSLACYPSLYYLTRRYRNAVIRWKEKSTALTKITDFFLIRFLAWLFIGEKKGDIKETADLRRSPIRKGFVIVAGSFIALVWVFSLLFGNALAKAGLESGASRASDSDVSVRELGLSFLRGSLAIEDMVVLKRDSNDSIIQAVKATGDLSVRDLLKRHLIFEEISVENMDFRVERDEKGRLNLDKKRKKQEEEEGSGFLGDADVLSKLWQQKDLARDMLEKLLDMLFPPDEALDTGKRLDDIKEECARLKNYAAFFADYLLEGGYPLVVVENFWIRGLKLRLEDKAEKGAGSVFDDLCFHATALSSNPGLYAKDSVLILGNNGLEDPTFRLELLLNWSSPDPVHGMEICLDKMPSEQVLEYIKPGDDLLFSGGEVELDSKTVFKRGGIHSTNRFWIFGVNVEPAESGDKIFGLDSELFCRGLTEFMKDTPLEVVAVIKGPYDDLEIEVDDKGLLEAVKKGIMRTGDRILQEKLNQQYGKIMEITDEKMDELKGRMDGKKGELQEKLNEKVGEKLGDKLDDTIGKDLEKGLEGLLKGKGGDDTGGGGLLDGLLGGGKKEEDEKKKDSGKGKKKDKKKGKKK